MRIIYINTILILIYFNSFSQYTDTTKVLFIGNSFTYYNDMPGMFQQIAFGANKNVVIASHTPGGISVGDIAQGTSAHMNNPIVFDLIRSNDWDYVVLQDNQGRFVNNYGVFPNVSLVIAGHQKIRDSLLYYHPCAKMIWFAGWGPKTGLLPYASTAAGLIDKIYSNYIYLQDSLQHIIAPIGPAWERMLLLDSTVNLWDADEVHPSVYGSAIGANIIYSTIFKSSALSSTFTPAGISSTLDSIIKQIAFETVVDSLYKSGLSNYTPIIQQVGDSLFINGYTNCNWYLNDSFITTANYIIVHVSGNYTATTTDVNNCNYLTFANSLNILQIPNENFKTLVKLYPNPISSKLTIESSLEIKQIEIYSIYGQTNRIYEFNNNNNNTIDLSDLENGVYFVKMILASNKFLIKKIIVEK